MKKTIVRSLIVMLGVLMMGMFMGCDGDQNTEDTKIVAEQYRGIFRHELYYESKDDNYKLEFKENTLIQANHNDKPNPAWTIENELFFLKDGVKLGYFKDNDTFILTHSQYDETYKRSDN